MVRATVVVALLLGPGCGDVAAPSDPVDDPPASEPAAAPGDPLLAAARQSLSRGIDPQVRAQIAASDAPQHRRAQRILAAMDAPAGEPTEPAAGPDTPVTDGPSPIVAPAPGAPPIPSAPAGAAAPTAGTTPTAAPTANAEPARPAPKANRRSRATLTKMSLKPRSGGATLTLHASQGVVVGVANQPAAGLVRLVVESAGAAAAVASARPHLRGVRVRDVKRGTDTVIVTLQLEPGWRFDRVTRFAGGAKVRLTGPS